MNRILVVDDDRPLLRALHITLSARGYDVHVAHDGRTALDVAAHHPPDLAVVDLGLPDMDGIAVITALRGWSAAPIIILSARQGEPAIINALDAGADDYVTKPFGMGELLARVRAALRRATPPATSPSSPPRRSRSTWPPNASPPPAGRPGSPPPSGTCWRSSSGTPASS